MTSSTGRAVAPEQSYASADAEIGWRIANPVMCLLIGLIAGGWNGGLIGLAAGVALVAAPYVLPPTFALARSALGWAVARLVAALRGLEQRTPAVRRLIRWRP
jgi:hypothetical protein